MTPSAIMLSLSTGASADCVFKLRNTGGADLHLADVKSIRGCTAAEIAKKTSARIAATTGSADG